MASLDQKSKNSQIKHGSKQNGLESHVSNMIPLNLLIRGFRQADAFVVTEKESWNLAESYTQ